MNSRVGSFIFLVAFSALATITSQLLWHLFDWLILAQLLIIFAIASLGESLVSSQGYYHYTRQKRNGPFVRNVPIWIVFLWIFFIQGGLLLSVALGLTGFAAASMSGMVACIIDFVLIEPFLSRYMELWRWTPVRRGYFSFIPARFNRFTAPPGNYIAWLIFPMIANGFLILLMHVF
jgi:magnesium-transporting ATPase (P-type)